MVRVLVGNEYRFDARQVAASLSCALEEAFARDPAVDQHRSRWSLHDGGISLRAACKYVQMNVWCHMIPSDSLLW